MSVNVKSVLARFDRYFAFSNSIVKTMLVCKACAPSRSTEFTLEVNAYAISDHILVNQQGFIEAVSHLKTAHNIQECQLCGSLMTKRGMTRHQNAIPCIRLRRKKTMHDRGYVPFPGSHLVHIKAALNDKTHALEQFQVWDDYDAFQRIEVERKKALEFFREGLGIVKALSESNDKNEWEVELWAPEESVTFMNLLVEVNYRHGLDAVHNFLRDISRFIELEEKGAAIGLLELQKEMQEQGE